MVQVHFKSEERQNPKECFKQATKRKMPKGSTEIKIEHQVGKDVMQKEEQLWENTKEEKDEKPCEDWRWMEMFGY